MSSMSVSLKRCSQCLVRHFSTRRAVPADSLYIQDLPVFQYPTHGENDKAVFAWGIAETGALGHLTHQKRKVMKKLAEYYHHPIGLHFSRLYKVQDIACGYGFTAFSIKPDGEKRNAKVFGTGLNTDSQIGYHAPRRDAPLALILNPVPIDIQFKHVDTRVTGIAGGRAHLMVLTDKEGVFTLGNNAYGQCGRPVIENENYSASQIINVIPNVDGSKIRAISCGQDHSIFISDVGKVYACGWGADGQTGQGHYESHWKPLPVTGDISGEDIVKVVGTADCVLALSSKGEVFGWGNSEYGQLAPDVLQLSSAKHLSFCDSLGRIVDVAAGGSFCMVLNENGQVFVWGYGILGKGPKVQKSLHPVEIPQVLLGKNEFQPDSKVTAISCGLYHLVAVTNKGDLFTWGHNRGGCLGLGHTDDQYFPFKVAIGAQVEKVVCGVDHTVALCQLL